MTTVTMANGPAMISDVASAQPAYASAMPQGGAQLIQLLMQSPAMQSLMMSASQSMFASPAMSPLLGGMSDMNPFGGMFGMNPMDPQAQQLQQMNMMTQAFASMGDDGGDDDGDE